ncbi:MAG: energy-coupling factor ABC transporter substrate-binding protein [archaeon]|nr:energy-coupling factor ABC transporter substrate-binding protein [archaeon]
MSMTKNQKIYIGCFAIIAVLCIGTLATVNGDFGGSDDAGGEVVEEYGYTPWTEDLFATIGFEMPGETESLLFALQAAIGAVIIGYFIGVTTATNRLKAQKGETAEE